MEDHVCSPETCPEPANYYVIALDGPRFYWMAGPYATHAESLAKVPIARDLANKHARSGRPWFMSWGTALAKDNDKPGSMNAAGLL